MDRHTDRPGTASVSDVGKARPNPISRRGEDPGGAVTVSPPQNVAKEFTRGVKKTSAEAATAHVNTEGEGGGSRMNDENEGQGKTDGRKRRRNRRRRRGGGVDEQTVGQAS